MTSARCRLGDPAGFEDDEAIGERDRVERIVGDEQTHAGERRELAAESRRTRRGCRVERGERLVEQEQPRARSRRPGERDPLRLTTRELAGFAPARSASRPASSQLRGLGASVAPWRAPRLRRPNATFSSTVRCGNRR